MSEIIYTVDGVDFKTYGVRVSESFGVVDGLKPKDPLIRANWPEYHGEIIDLGAVRFEPREIELRCWIKASGRLDFMDKLNAFMQQFYTSGLKRLQIAIDDEKPLCFEVYLSDRSEVEKKWRENKMFGTFSLKLREPEPVKRLLRYTRTGPGDAEVTITLTSSKLLNIYWGDGEKTVDVSGTDEVVTHTYASNGTYFIIIAGVIDEIESFTTNATTVWSKY